MNDLMIKTGFDINDGLKSLKTLQVNLDNVIKNSTIKVNITNQKKVLSDATKLGADVNKTLSNANLKLPPIDVNNFENSIEGILSPLETEVKEIGTKVKNELKDVFKPLETASKESAKNVAKEFPKRLRDERGRFIKAGEEIGNDLGDSINETVTNSFSNLAIADIIGNQLSQVGDLFTAASQGALDYENALGRLNIASKGNVEVFEELKTSAENIFKQGIGESFDEVAQTITKAQISLGNLFNPQELEEFTAGAFRLGKAFDEDVNNILLRSRTFISEFGLSGKEALDLITLGFRDAANADEDILDTFNEFSGIAKNAGFSAETFTQTLINGVQLGARNTDLLANSILEAGIRLNDLSASKTISEIGGETSKVITDILKLGESGAITVEDTLRRANSAINEAFDAGEIGDSIRQQMQVAISGTPAEDLGSELYSRLFTENNLPINEIQKTASEASSLLEKSFVKDAFAPIQRTFSLLFDSIASAATPLLSVTGNILSTTAQFAPTFQLLQSNIGIINDFAKNLLTKLVPAYATTAKSAIGAGTASVTAGNAVKVAWLSALAPFALIIGAIGAVVGAFILAYRNIEPFQEAIDNLVINIKSFAATIIEQVRPVLEQVGGLFLEIATFIKNILVFQLNVLINVFSNIVKSVMRVLNAVGLFKGGLSETISITKATGLAFKSLGIIIEAMRKTLAGVSSAFTVISERLQMFIDGLTSFNISKALKAFSGLGDELGTAFKDGYEGKANEIQDIKIQKEYFVKLKDEVKKVFDEASELSPTALLANIKDTEQQIRASREANKISESQAKELNKSLLKLKERALNEQNELTRKKNIESANNSVEINKQELEKRKQSYEKYINDIAKLQGEVNSILIDIENQVISGQITDLERLKDDTLKNVSIVESERLKRVLEIDNEIYEIRLQNELKNIDDGLNAKIDSLDKERSESLKNELLTNNEKIKLEEVYQEKLNVLTLQADIKREKIKDSLNKDRLDNELNAAKKINEATTKEFIESEKKRINLIKDTVKRERQLRLFEAEQGFSKQLESVKGNYNLELELFIEYTKKKEQIEKDYISKSKSQAGIIVSEVGSSLSRALENSDLFNVVSKQRDNAAIQLLDKEKDILEKALKENKISYQDYQNELLDINQKRVGLESQQNKQVLIDFNILRKEISKTFEGISEDAITTINSNNDKLETLRKGILELDELILNTDKNNAKEYEELLQKRNDLETQSLEITKETYSQIGIAIGATFAQAIADQKSFAKATVMSVLAGLKASVQLLAVEILGKEFASKGFLGIATAGALTGILFAALSAAEGYVNKLSFKKGGLNPFGFSNDGLAKTHTIEYAEGNKPEFIFNSETTRKNLDAFTEINRRNITIEQYVNDKRSNDNKDMVKELKEVKELLRAGAITSHIYKNYNIKSENKEIKSVARETINYR